MNTAYTAATSRRCIRSLIISNRHTVNMSHRSDSNRPVNSSPSRSSDSTYKRPCARKISRETHSASGSGLPSSVSFADGANTEKNALRSPLCMAVTIARTTGFVNSSVFIRTIMPLHSKDMIIRVRYLIHGCSHPWHYLLLTLWQQYLFQD